MIAGELSEKHALAGFDSVHLASAIDIQDAMGIPLPFITADERQLAAARDCKLETIAVVR